MNKTSDIIDYIKDVKGFETDTELAKVLDVGQNTVSTWRGKDSFPIKKIIKYCDKENISLAKFMNFEEPPSNLINESTTSYKIIRNRDWFHNALDEILDSDDKETILALEMNMQVFRQKIRDKRNFEDRLKAVEKELQKEKKLMEPSEHNTNEDTET